MAIYQMDRGKYCVSRCTSCHAALPETEPEPLWRVKWGVQGSRGRAMTMTIYSRRSYLLPV